MKLELSRLLKWHGYELLTKKRYRNQVDLTWKHPKTGVVIKRFKNDSGHTGVTVDGELFVIPEDISLLTERLEKAGA